MFVHWNRALDKLSTPAEPTAPLAVTSYIFAPAAAHILAEPPASNVIKVSTSLPKPVACDVKPFRKATSVSPGKKLSRISASVSDIKDCESRTFHPPIGEGYDPFSAITRHILILVHLQASLRTHRPSC